MVRASGRSSSGARRGAWRDARAWGGRVGRGSVPSPGPAANLSESARRGAPAGSGALPPGPGRGRFRPVVRVGRTLRRRRVTATLTPTAQPIQLTGEFVKKITNSSRARSFSVFRSVRARPCPRPCRRSVQVPVPASSSFVRRLPPRCRGAAAPVAGAAAGATLGAARATGHIGSLGAARGRGVGVVHAGHASRASVLEWGENRRAAFSGEARNG